jgi:RND family efflux transporter MFP subunit
MPRPKAESLFSGSRDRRGRAFHTRLVDALSLSERMGLRACTWTALLGAMGGCARGSAAPPAPPPPIVTVAVPVEQEVIESRDFTGRTAAIDSVVVRARVTGYLEKVLFKEGAEVQAGDSLYEIDPRPYQAVLSQAEGNVAAAEAKLVRLQADLERARKLLADGVISQEDFDRTTSDLAETTGTLHAVRAAVERARLDLEFTHIRAPIAGLTGRSELDVGNLVMADDTALTSIVSIDPIHANFDVDERSVLLYRERIREKKVQSAREAEVSVLLGLANEDGYPHRGQIDFVDNQLDPTSGTIRARAVFPNPERTISPGFFVRIRVPFDKPHPALLVDEHALGADQRGWYVYVVDGTGTVQHRPVEIGARSGGRVVIEQGLAAGERVIVNGIQRARPGGKVEAREERVVAQEPVPEPGGVARSQSPAAKNE